MITVFFDGKCGLCSREIHHYQKVAPRGYFNWVDIASDPEPLRAIGISQEAALMRLHVQSVDGVIHIGVDAFRTIWGHLTALASPRPGHRPSWLLFNSG
ncbi:MAG: thiol-disulfide oxidoreductase DCC family protein [Arenicellales bacterium]